MLKRLSLVLMLCLAGTFAWAAAPAITNFAPTRGVVGTVVTITGTDLNGATTVVFNGVRAKAYSCNSATSLIALVPEGATSGKITVTNTSGSAISTTYFVVLIGLENNAKDSASMVWVPGGTFTMGSVVDKDNSNAQPAHQVTLSGYWIYQYDVTVAQYRAFCTATGHALPRFPFFHIGWANWISWNDPALQQHPMTNVSWIDAEAYADWAGVTLPTEAQWEYAARGPQGNNYPWGGTAAENDIHNGWDETKCANYGNSYRVNKSIRPVGSFPAGASWCGAQDMAGNVMQWCADWHSAYTAAVVTNPTGPDTGKYRMLRGGSWSDEHYGYRSAGRYFYDVPEIYRDDIGFRCVSVSPGPNLARSFARVAVPIIDTIAPSSAIVGTVITITGTDLDKATAVTFNGIATKTITDNTATSLKVTVPEGATSGKLVVTTAGGTVTNSYDFIVLSGLKTNAKDKAEMVWVPGGTFTMGSPAGLGMGDVHPAHPVTLSGFWIYQYDVTVAQYRTFCAATGHKLPFWPRGEYSWKGKTGWDDPALQQHPIVEVSWDDAKAYADWAGVALPTEAQWEYTACGPQRRNFPWGGTVTKDEKYDGWDATKCANRDNSERVGKSTWPVGSFPADTSWCGAQDMAGNVQEWCGDWYDLYTAAAVTNPTGPNKGDFRVRRGGSWHSYTYKIMNWFRDINFPSNCSYTTGFRCASPAPGPK